MQDSHMLTEKWAPLLDYQGAEAITDPHRRAVTAQLLENQEKFQNESRAFQEGGSMLSEAPTNATGGAVDNFDPVLISLIRRSMPNLIAYDVAGVQPMNGPTGLIFAMRARYNNQTGSEALFNEADSAFSAQDSGYDVTQGDYTGGSDDGISVGFGSTAQTGSNPSVLGAAGGSGTAYGVGQGMSTADAESLGDTGDLFNEMAFSIEKVTVTAKSRALKAEYSLELAQDLKAIHGLSAESELSNILSSEILSEINREVVRTIYKVARPGAQANVSTAGQFDLDIDSNGRWSVEKFKGLMFQLERDANAIAQETRRGKGNVIICSSDVASALQMAGVLDYTPALNNNLNVDDAGNTFAGVLNGRFKVYIDPYSANQAAKQYYTVGYKGTSPYDAGLFYCPYVPLQMVRAVGENTFQPKIGFKTRYGLTANPFAGGATVRSGALTANDNVYYRRVQVTNIM